MSHTVSQYCQRCLMPNPVGRELCARCGTRLMLVVEPPSERYGRSVSIDEAHEEHLLERVSAVEAKVARLTERVEEALNLLSTQARNSYFDRSLISALADLLSDVKVIDRRELDELWIARCQSDLVRQAEQERRKKYLEAIVNGPPGSRPQPFIEQVYAAFELIDRGENAKGVRLLERAAALAPSNADLNGYLGEYFFSAGKLAVARDYLARSLGKAEHGMRMMLLGLAEAELGRHQAALPLLKRAAEGAQSFAVHVTLGKLLAAGQNWPDAISEFKKALAARRCPEAHYVLGCAYYETGQHRLATRHLRKALEMDQEYVAAHYMLGLVLKRSGADKSAVEAFKTACEAGSGETFYKRAARKVLRHGDLPETSPFFKVGDGSKGLIRNSDKRLAELVRLDALNEVLQSGVIRK